MSAVVRDFRELDGPDASAAQDLTGRLAEAINPARWTVTLRLLAFSVEVIAELGAAVLAEVVNAAENRAS